MAYWPTQLPKPQLAGYSLAPQAAFVRSDMDAGPARQRRRFTQAPTEITLELVLTDAQMAIFEFWYEIETQSGAAWFSAPMKNGMGVTTVEARFVEPWQSQPLGAAMNRVQCRWETRNRPVMSSDEYLSLLDIPALEFDFAGTGSILQVRTSELQPVASIEFTRNSSATYFGSDGLLKTTSANEPRIDYDPVTGECKGFLVEEARTNLLLRSEEFENAGWVKTRASIEQNVAVAPNGTLTADRFFEDTTANNTHQLVQTASFTSGQLVTFSVYAKTYSRRLELRFTGVAFSDNQAAVFNLADGTAHATAGTPTFSMASIGNGWYRCWITATSNSTAGASATFRLFDPGTSSYTGDGTSGVYIWGAQLEEGAFPTSYIKTESTAVTRAADSAVMTGSNFSSWYRQDEGTVYLKSYMIPQPTFFKDFIDFSDGTSNNRHFITVPGNTSFVSSRTTANSAAQSALNSSSLLAGEGFASVYAYKANDFAAVTNGSTPVSDVSGTLPAVNQLIIGGRVGLNNTCHIKRLDYYPKRLANAKLQALTQ